MVRNTRSGSGDVHTVSLDESGDVVGCSCKGYQFNQSCYHVDHVRSSPLLLSSARATVASSQDVATDGGTPTRLDAADYRRQVERETADESDDLPAIEDVGDHRCRCTGCGREGVKDLDREPVILHTRDCPNAEDDR